MRTTQIITGVTLLSSACAFHVQRGSLTFKAPNSNSQTSRISPQSRSHDHLVRHSAVESRDGDSESNDIALRVAQVGYAVCVAGLIDGGFSGDWSRFGYISTATEETLQHAAFGLIGINAVTACAAAFLESSREGGNAPAAFAAGVMSGPLELLRVLGLGGATKEVGAKSTGSGGSPNNNTKPLQMVINSVDIALTAKPAAVMLSSTIIAAADKVAPMRAVLEKLVAAIKEEQEDLVYTMTVNQDPEDLTVFFMLQRFPSVQALSAHQETEPFKEFTTAVQPLLAEPMGLYLVNERNGMMTEPVYPYGPGGEGGRDDSIYSSPANLQGSQSRARIDPSQIKNDRKIEIVQ